MAESSNIVWTHSSWNPWWGCTKVSPLCDFCYAERDSKRYGFDVWGQGKERRYFGDKHWNEPLKWNAKAAKTSEPWRVFCASMADIFDNEVEQEHRERLWVLIKQTPALTWLVLTKRIGNAKRMLPKDWGAGYSNVWLGISVGNQEEADRDIPKLLQTRARIRWLSVEPMLGPVNLRQSDWLTATCCRYGKGQCDVGVKISWVVCGGESGPRARPMEVEWARAMREQCKDTGVPFFFKQGSQSNWPRFRDFESFPKDLRVREYPTV
jgi:protein gp37